MHEEERNLTDADVKAIATALKAQLVGDFYGEMGRGVWALVRRAFFPLLLILAVYGMSQDKSITHNLFTDHS